MVVNITFLSFLLFSMCKSIHDAVNTWINCSFFLLIYRKGLHTRTAVARNPCVSLAFLLLLASYIPNVAQRSIYDISVSMYN